MNITQFEPANLKLLRAEIDAALAPICAKYGIAVQVGKMTYDHAGSEFRAPMTWTVPAIKGEKDRALLMQFCGFSGLDPDMVSRDGFILVRYDAKRRTRPWIGVKAGTTKPEYLFDERGAKQRWTSANAPKAPKITLVDNLIDDQLIDRRRA